MTRGRALLAVLILAVGLAGAGVVWMARRGITVDRGTSTHSGPIARVEVQIDAGKVDVAAGPDGDADAGVRRERHYLTAAPALTETFVDGVLRITGSCPRIVAIECAVDIRVDAPPATPVLVRSGRGAVSVTGMTGGVDVATSAGAVHLSGIGGPITARTSTGAIDGVDLAPTAVDATTSAGAIRLSLSQPAQRIDLASGDGAVDLALPGAEGGYRVTTTSRTGTVAVTVAQDPTSGRAVSARTGAGRITVHPR
jgi:hypothetical protein